MIVGGDAGPHLDLLLDGAGALVADRELAGHDAAPAEMDRCCTGELIEDRRDDSSVGDAWCAVKAIGDAIRPAYLAVTREEAQP